MRGAEWSAAACENGFQPPLVLLHARNADNTAQLAQGMVKYSVLACRNYSKLATGAC